MSTASSPATPVLTFLLSVRHPFNSTNYARVEELLIRTLRSLDAQSDRRCVAVVVVNQKITIPADLDIPVRVLLVDYPPPSLHRGPSTGREAVLLDKGTKLAAAFSLAESDHVMFVDADDFVSQHLTSFVAAHANAPGWYVDHGLVVNEKAGVSRRVSRFNEICGTSLVVRRELLPSVDITVGATQQDVLTRYGSKVVREVFGSHRYLAERYGLEPLPFVGAAYSISTGENHSGKHMSQLGTYLKSLTRTEFGMPAPSIPASWMRYATYVGSVLGHEVVRIIRMALRGTSQRYCPAAVKLLLTDLGLRRGGKTDHAPRP